MVERMISMRRIGTGKNITHKKIRFSKIEIKDLAKAWVILSLAFAILLSGLESVPAFLIMFVIAALTVGVGFLFHEIAHKLVAQHYGCWAEFRAFNNMLMLALVMSFFGFLLAAPGAVMIQGMINKEKNGRISLAGPLTNIILAIIFLLISLIPSPIITPLANYGFLINTWLALFNMIPFGIFDGAKIMAWNKKIWGFFFAVVLLLFALPYIM